MIIEKRAFFHYPKLTRIDLTAFGDDVFPDSWYDESEGGHHEQIFSDLPVTGRLIMEKGATKPNENKTSRLIKAGIVGLQEEEEGIDEDGKH